VIKKFTGILLVLALFGSCSKSGDYIPYNYNVLNNTGGHLKVEVNGFIGTYGFPVNISDSVVRLLPGEEKTICVLLSSEPGCANPEAGYDSLHAIQTIHIFLDDTVLSNKNYRLTKYWQFKKIDNHEGELDLQVADQDFIK
jgi:hypothetical protein